MGRRSIALAAFLWLATAPAHAAGSGIPMLDKDGASQGSAKVNLEKGSVKVTATLAALPATIDTGTEQFEAHIYKAYLVSSTDPAVEIPLATVYPTVLGKVAMKATLKGDVSAMGLDRVVIVAYSKDGISSFDVLTGTLVAP